MPSQRTFRIVGLGELLWDCLPGGRRLGGAPANVVYHVTAFGDQGALASRVGADAAGDAALAALADHGVDVAAVQRDPQRATGEARVVLERGEPRFSIDAEAAWAYPEWTPAWEALCASADALCFGTLLCARPAGRRVLERAAAAAPPRALRLLDVNLRPPLDPPEALSVALACANVVKLSAAEVPVVARHLGVDDAVAALLARGDVQAVAVTRGAAGSVVHTPRARHRQPAAALPPGATGGDPVGAGDAFTAALAHHLVREHPIERASAAASRYAAFVAGSAGAMPRVPPEIRRAVVGESAGRP